LQRSCNAVKETERFLYCFLNYCAGSKEGMDIDYAVNYLGESSAKTRAQKAMLQEKVLIKLPKC